MIMIKEEKRELLSSLSSRTVVYKGQLKKLSRRYRDKVRLNEDLLIKKYKECRRLELGLYRHNNVYVNYDMLKDEVLDKYASINFAFSQELIHNLSNRVNDLIFQTIVEYEQQRTDRKRSINSNY